MEMEKLKGDENNINVIDLINEEEADGEDGSSNNNNGDEEGNNNNNNKKNKATTRKRTKKQQLNTRKNKNNNSNNQFRTSQYQTTQDWWEAECRVNETMNIEKETGIGIIELVEDPIMVIPTYQTY